MDTDQPQGTTGEPVNPAPEAAEVVTTQPEAMPTSNQQSTEGQTAEAADHSTQSESDLPEAASERTRREFEKLKEQLRQEKAKNQARETYGSSVFDSFRGPEAGATQVDASQFGNLNQAQVSTIQQQFIDAEGNVDVHGLNQALLLANQRAERAERTSRETSEKIERWEETQQVKEAHTVHPELDPRSDNFDPQFFDLVRDRALRNMYEGRKQTLLEMATEVRKVYSQPTQPVNVAKVREEAVAEFKQTQELRNQGPIETGKGQPRQATIQLEELRERTRQGDDAALSARLRAYEKSEGGNT